MNAESRSRGSWRMVPFLLCLPLTACFSFGGEKYPPAWPSLSSEGNCSSISGTYVDSGERIGENTFEHASLSSALGHYKSQPFAFPTDRVRISFGDGDDVMEVKVWTMDRPVGTIRFSRVAGDFKCYWGSIEISRSEFLAGAMVAGSETEAIRVSKAVDGSLILRRSDSAYGVAGGVIPIVATRVVSWSRFAAATAN